MDDRCVTFSYQIYTRACSIAIEYPYARVAQKFHIEDRIFDFLLFVLYPKNPNLKLVVFVFEFFLRNYALCQIVLKSRVTVLEVYHLMLKVLAFFAKLGSVGK